MRSLPSLPFQKLRDGTRSATKILVLIALVVLCVLCAVLWGVLCGPCTSSFRPPPLFPPSAHENILVPSTPDREAKKTYEFSMLLIGKSCAQSCTGLVRALNGLGHSKKNNALLGRGTNVVLCEKNPKSCAWSCVRVLYAQDQQFFLKPCVHKTLV